MLKGACAIFTYSKYFTHNLNDCNIKFEYGHNNSNSCSVGSKYDNTNTFFRNIINNKARNTDGKIKETRD